ncbi:MAG: LuxR C-terminal-related transcriptional regulator [Actinomycetota bacterium]|nr:LuxR C-terminal-related transcriptional regulator [Actinomycetota bacterium]
MTKNDLAAVSGFVRDAQLIQGPAPFRRELLDRMAQMFRCDYTAYNELDIARRAVISYVGCSEEGEDTAGPPIAAADWDQLVAGLVVDRDYERDGIVTSSDIYPREQRVAFQVGPSYAAEDGIVDTMCARLGPPGARFVLSSRDRDFNARDRWLMHELQPHLFGLWHRATMSRRLAAAHAALDQGEGDGVILVDPHGEIEFANAAAERLVGSHLGVPPAPLPAEIATWRENGHVDPLAITTADSTLVVQAMDGGSTLLLRGQPAGVALLTRREREVMRGVAAGLSNHEIGRRLWIEVPTVRKHLEHVFAKLGVKSRTGAVARLGRNL